MNVELDRDQFHVRGRRICVELFYPRLDNRANEIEIGLSDVRSSDGLLISFDFDRNGWSIKQASTFSWDCDDTVCDPDWQEVAFIEAWGREKKEPTND